MMDTIEWKKITNLNLSILRTRSVFTLISQNPTCETQLVSTPTYLQFYVSIEAIYKFWILPGFTGCYEIV